MSIEDQIKTYISRNLIFSEDGFPYKDDDFLLDLGVIDLLGIMALVAFVEDTYIISVEDQEIVPKNFDSVAYLAAYVRSKVKV